MRSEFALLPLMLGLLITSIGSGQLISRTGRYRIYPIIGSALLVIGVISGYLGAAPSLVWASGAFFITFAPVLLPLAIWIYTLVFAFSALWFAHFALSSLAALRAERASAPAGPATPLEVSPAPVTALLPPV